MGERGCHPEGEGSDLSRKVDELMTMIQTMRMETAEMKNMLTDTLNKNNNKENDDEEVSHRGTMTQYSHPLHVATTIPQFSFTSAAAAAATTIMPQQQPSFGRRTHGGPHFTFGRQPLPVQSNFVLGVGAGNQQNNNNIPPLNIPSPIFQASGSLEFNGGGSFSLGTGGGDKSGRKFVKVRHKQRKK